MQRDLRQLHAVHDFGAWSGSRFWVGTPCYLHDGADLGSIPGPHNRVVCEQLRRRRLRHDRRRLRELRADGAPCGGGAPGHRQVRGLGRPLASGTALAHTMAAIIVHTVATMIVQTIAAMTVRGVSCESSGGFRTIIWHNHSAQSG